MQQYLDLMRRVRTQGVRKTDRTGTGTLSVFGHQMRFDLAEGFPLVTTKKLHLKSIIHELIWFLPATPTSLSQSQWRPHLGRMGRRERRSRPRLRQAVAILGSADGRIIDQISEVVETLKTNPDSRRMIVTAWNPADIPDMALAPCHCLFQFYVADGRLSCQLYQRSADVFLGVPFNIASYALLTMMMAQVTGLEAGEFVHTFGDAHLYLNHLEQADLQLARAPRALPRCRSIRRSARSSSSSTRTSSSWATTRIRTSRPRWRFDLHDGAQHSPGVGLGHHPCAARTSRTGRTRTSFRGRISRACELGTASCPISSRATQALRAAGRALDPASRGRVCGRQASSARLNWPTSPSNATVHGSQPGCIRLDTEESADRWSSCLTGAGATGSRARRSRSP